MSFDSLTRSANLVELQGQSALLVSSRILVQNALGNSLIDFLHGNLVSAIGLGAIAFCGSDLELLDGGLQGGLLGLVAGVSRFSDQNALLGRLNIRQTKHLLRQNPRRKYTMQDDILAVVEPKSKSFFTNLL